MSVSFENILEAAKRIDGVAVKTPLLCSEALNDRLGSRIFLKPECLQHIGAFKFRGAYNRLCQIDDAKKKSGVVAFSSGNHAQGVAYAAKLLGIDATIVMPTDAPQIKKEGTQSLGASIRYYDRHTESREDIAAEIAESKGATLVPAFDDIDIIAGQGTCALELMQQLEEQQITPNSVLTPAGGGGLLAGSSVAVKGFSNSSAVYGVEQENFDDHFLSRQAGHRVNIDSTVPTLCDALMAKTPGEITWSINSKTVDDFLVVTEDEIAHAVAYAFRYLKLVVEPGGAVALAALLSEKLKLRGQVVAIVLSGGNIDRDTLVRCLDAHPSP